VITEKGTRQNEHIIDNFLATFMWYTSSSAQQMKIFSLEGLFDRPNSLNSTYCILRYGIEVPSCFLSKTANLSLEATVTLRARSTLAQNFLNPLVWSKSSR
jgi:hypothetical protein